MSKQRHDIGWQKAHREGRATAGQAAAARRGRAKVAKAARRAELMEAAYLAGEKVEREAIRARERAAAGHVQAEPQPEPQPVPAPEPQPASEPLHERHCARCATPFRTERRYRYCSAQCRMADTEAKLGASAPPRDRPHRALIGASK